MNNKVLSIIESHNLHPIAYEKRGKVLIIIEKNKKYVLKDNTSNYDIYKYLMSRDFYYFPENLNNESDNYDLSLYLDNIVEKKEQKIEDYINVLALLHKKTSYDNEMDLDNIKEIFDQNEKKIIETRKYYEEMNDLIVQELFISPSKYLLLRNISVIYFLLDYAEQKNNDWFLKRQENKKREIALLHNNIDLDHLIINEEKYFINWDKAYFDSPIVELKNFYEEFYQNLSLASFLDKYQLIHKLKPLDLELLLIELSIPKIIPFTKDTYLDTINLNKEIKFLQRIYDYLLKDSLKNKNIVAK